MEYLLSQKNKQILESFSLAHTLFGFDFDGTLVPIADNPDQVQLHRECEKLLNALNESGPVAIITGRSIDDIKKYFPFSPKYLIGNHGIEGIHEPHELEIIKNTILEYKKTILDKHAENFARLGIVLEDKVYSLTLHFRNASNPLHAELFLLSHLGYLPKAKVTKGKMVLNILPFNVINKGRAFVRLMETEQTKFGFYIGDDVTDEDVFIYKNPKLLTVRIGFSEDSHAEYFLHNQAEVVKVLEIICRTRNPV